MLACDHKKIKMAGMLHWYNKTRQPPNIKQNSKNAHEYMCGIFRINSQQLLEPAVRFAALVFLFSRSYSDCTSNR